MRTPGSLHPTDGVDVPPDTVGCVLLTTTAQNFDYPANAQIVRLAVSNPTVWVSWQNVTAVVPTASASGSSNNYEMFTTGVEWRQIPGGSTGYSVIAASAGGFATLSMYKK